nr:rod-binding protein [Sphingobium sp. B2]
MDIMQSLPITPASAPSAAATRTRAAAGPEAIARDFEAVFLGQMAQMMLESVEVDQTFGGGHGEEMFRGILAEKLGREFAARGGIGLSDAVRAQIIRLQEGTQP